jgi:hypothetical protein
MDVVFEKATCRVIDKPGKICAKALLTLVAFTHFIYMLKFCYLIIKHTHLKSLPELLLQHKRVHSLTTFFFSASRLRDYHFLYMSLVVKN